MDKSPVKVMRRFMEIVDRKVLPNEHVDYELNAALKSGKRHGRHRHGHFGAQWRARGYLSLR